MKFLHKYRWIDLPLNLLVLVFYIIFAKIGLFFALQSPTITIFWPAGGLALAILLLGGLKFLPGIFVGGVVAGFMAVDIPWVATMLGVADTVESFSAYWLLSHYCNFHRDLDNRQDFFKLTLLAGALASAISALIGPTSLLVSNIIPAGLYQQIAMRWWMGDVLGIAFLTPLILTFSKRPQKLMSKTQIFEVVALFSLTFLVGQTVFFDWFRGLTDAPQSVAWIIPFIIWAGLRAGRHVTTALQLMLFIQALWSASHGVGDFANDMVQSGLVNFWMFGMVMAVGGMALAVMATENRKVQKEWHRLNKSIASSLNEIYLFHADTLRFFFINRGARQNLGYSMKELKLMTPLDLKPFYTEQSFQKLVSPLKRHETSVVTFETMHKRKNGSLYPVEVHLQLFEDDNEHYFQAVVLDITVRRAAEQDLRLAAQVFENSTDGIEITDADYRIVSVNRAFTQISGYTEEEAKGKNPNLLSSGMHDQSFYQAMWDSIHRYGLWQGEIWNRRKNGEIYPEWLNISVIRDSQGAVVNHIGIFSDITERKAAENFLKHQAQHDFLTNLPNRTLFHDRFQQLLARVRRDNEKFALLYLDLDNFKPINDTYGHHIGDLLLQAIATRLTEATRQTDTICRQGGDEFTILMPGITSENEAQVLTGKLLVVFEQPYLIEGISLCITASIGTAIYPDHGDDGETLMARADEAMYQAKRNRRTSN